MNSLKSLILSLLMIVLVSSIAGAQNQELKLTGTEESNSVSLSKSAFLDFTPVKSGNTVQLDISFEEVAFTPEWNYLNYNAFSFLRSSLVLRRIHNVNSGDNNLNFINQSGVTPFAKFNKFSAYGSFDVINNSFDWSTGDWNLSTGFLLEYKIK